MFRYIKLGKTKARVFGNLICLVLMMFEFDISSLMIWFATFRCEAQNFIKSDIKQFFAISWVSFV